MNKIIATFILSFLLLQFADAQPTLKVTLLDGTAKVQRSQKKSWENLSLGDEINDNDIIETFFQTKTAFQFGVDNVLILGSNTRALCNIKEVQQDKYKVLDVNITLFNGGALVKILSNSRASIYTSNAVAQIDSGTISTVVEAKTGHTGFQLLGGKAQVRNVSQQQGKNLSSGLTTIVLPGKEPTAPLDITYRHVAVLKHFFGDDYIQRQIDEAGIEPTEEQTSTNRLSLSQNLSREQEEAKSGIQKKVFSQNKIWGSILEDRIRKRKWYEPIPKPYRVHPNKGVLTFISTIGIAGGNVYPKFQLLPSFYFPKFSIGLNLPLAKNYNDRIKMGFSSAAGIFDKIHHLTIGSIDSLYPRYFMLGPIENYTIGDGLIVRNYYNKNIYTTTQPLGVKLLFKKETFKIDAFISDITNWYVGGLHISLFPGPTWLGLGYYYDANQFYNTVNNTTSRFLDFNSMESNISSSIDKKSYLYKSNIHLYEINFGFSHSLEENTAFDLLFQFAQKFEKEVNYDSTFQFGSDTFNLTDSKVPDFVIKGPEFRMNIKNFHFGISYIAESGKLTNGYFSSMYMSNRLRLLPQYQGVGYKTQNNNINHYRKAYAFAASFATTIIKGTSIDLTFQQDFLAHEKYKVRFLRTVFDTISISPIDIDTHLVSIDTTLLLNENNNFGFTLSFSINENLLKPIKYAKVFLNQVHGGHFPNTGNYFSSWGFNAGFELLTAPLFFNIALEGGLIFTYIDLYDENGILGMLNDVIDNNDTLLEFYLGLRWGFL